MTDAWDTISPEVREEIETGEVSIKQLHRYETYERWLWIGVALDRLQNEAMRIAGTNDPTGRTYNDAYKQLGKHAPHLVKIDKAVRSRAIWMARNRVDIDQWLADVKANERLKLNHPNTIKRAYDRYEQDKAPTDLDNPKPPSARVKLQDQVTALQEENDQLRVTIISDRWKLGKAKDDAAEVHGNNSPAKVRLFIKALQELDGSEAASKPETTAKPKRKHVATRKQPVTKQDDPLPSSDAESVAS